MGHFLKTSDPQYNPDTNPADLDDIVQGMVRKLLQLWTVQRKKAASRDPSGLPYRLRVATAESARLLLRSSASRAGLLAPDQRAQLAAMAEAWNQCRSNAIGDGKKRRTNGQQPPQQRRDDDVAKADRKRRRFREET